ncbi:hypothetical protein CEXT_444351 [Caerostris extrusa]|uniref:Uncharacterized protein n=1 Tax=Caerostris extrusa TaxID=172846 RepID=A0AAV4XJA9_CAEEX|nr:hypothetical protein CEXT_444351 [Caerostris extrusa]
MGDIPFLNCRRISPDAIGFLRENKFISDASGAICFVLGKQSYLGNDRYPFHQDLLLFQDLVCFDESHFGQRGPFKVKCRVEVHENT